MLGDGASAIQGDLSSVEECQRVVLEARQALGGIDVLVNNAGLSREVAFEETSEELFDFLFRLNVRGYFFCAQEALAHMPPEGGAVVNITSVHGRGGLPQECRVCGDEGCDRRLDARAGRRARAASSARQRRRPGRD